MGENLSGFSKTYLVILAGTGMFVHIPTVMVHWFDGRIRVCRRSSEEAKVASDKGGLNEFQGITSGVCLNLF